MSFVHDDVVYGTLLIFSVVFGRFFKGFHGEFRRQIASSGIGLFFVLLVCRWHFVHSFITIIGNCCIIKLWGPRKCHTVSFIWCFSYIVFFRTTTYFGLPQVPSHANAIQLLLTLKLVGIAFEVHDTDELKYKAEKCDDETEKHKLNLQYKYQFIDPPVTNMLMYSYCYIGLLTGPYYKYRTYIDMIRQKNPETIDSETSFRARIKWAPVYGAVFIVLSQMFSIRDIEREEFFDQPFWYRLFYMVPMFAIFRMRFYTAWVLSECMCITAGLGAYPKKSKPKSGLGPSNFEELDKCLAENASSVEYDFETIHNIEEYQTEFAPTIRDGMRYWNMTVQFWLANYVYKRAPKSFRTSVTMAVSAFWHGIHPGYYLSFLSAPPYLLAEGAMTAAFRDGASPRQQAVFDWCCWICKMRFFEYGAMSFVLLDFTRTLRYWSSVYFIVHVLNIVFLVIGKKYANRRLKEKQSSQKEQ